MNDEKQLPTNGQTNPGQLCNRSQACNQTQQSPLIWTQEKIKETIIETLIELNLVPKPTRKKVITTA